MSGQERTYVQLAYHFGPLHLFEVQIMQLQYPSRCTEAREDCQGDCWSTFKIVSDTSFAITGIITPLQLLPWKFNCLHFPFFPSLSTSTVIWLHQIFQTCSNVRSRLNKISLEFRKTGSWVQKWTNWSTTGGPWGGSGDVFRYKWERQLPETD